MIDITLPPGGHARYWVVEVQPRTNEPAVTLPALKDWHQAVGLLNHLTEIYGKGTAVLYQWEVSSVYADRHDL